MGLFSRGMKDPVRGSAQVVSSSAPPHNATHANCKMTIVVQAPGVEPFTKKVHELIVSTAKWPYPGETLPVTVDRAKPDRVKIEWDDVATGEEVAAQQAEAMVARLRGGEGAAGDAGAEGIVGQIQQLFLGARVVVGNVPGAGPAGGEIGLAEQALGVDLDGDGRVGPAPEGAAAAEEPDADPGDRIAQLERLARLRDAGALTEDEFVAEKQRVLGD